MGVPCAGDWRRWRVLARTEEVLVTRRGSKHTTQDIESEAGWGAISREPPSPRITGAAWGREKLIAERLVGVDLILGDSPSIPGPVALGLAALARGWELSQLSVTTSAARTYVILNSHRLLSPHLSLCTGAPIELIQPETLKIKALEPVLLLGRQRFANLDLRIRVKGGGHVSQMYGECAQTRSRGGLGCWGHAGKHTQHTGEAGNRRGRRSPAVEIAQKPEETLTMTSLDRGGGEETRAGRVCCHNSTVQKSGGEGDRHQGLAKFSRRILGFQWPISLIWGRIRQKHHTRR
jgi:hypothetical protein